MNLKTLVLLICTGLCARAAQIQALQTNDLIRVLSGDHPVFDYHMHSHGVPRPEIKPVFARGAYIHPIYTPAGKIVSDDYATNHLHHHGIWFSWAHTSFEDRKPDFWNMGDGTGTVEFEKLVSVWNGAKDAGFISEHRYLDKLVSPPKAALNETWRVTAHPPENGANIFDLECIETCASDSKLELTEYRYGGLGFRGRAEWNGAASLLVLTSEGETNRVKANTTNARWCWLGGKVDDGIAGIAILCHPANFRAPQPIRVHPDEPFFCYAPSQGGTFNIEPGKAYSSRYRFVVLDGKPDAARIEQFWKEYTAEKR